MKWMPDSLLPVGKWSAVYVAPVILQVRCEKMFMEGGQNSDSDQFSHDDSFNALTDEDFDLLHLTGEETAELVTVVNWEENKKSGVN